VRWSSTDLQEKRSGVPLSLPTLQGQDEQFVQFQGAFAVNSCKIYTNRASHQKHVKHCRQAVAGVILDEFSYPTPAPEPQANLNQLPDEDLQEGDDMYDYDPLSSTTPMDEDRVVDEEETLVDALVHVSATNEPNDLEDDSLTIDGDDDGDYNDERDNNHESHSPDPDKPKARWSEDTVQTEAMSRLGICVNTAARVVVCLACSTVVRPLHLPAHLAKTHSPMSTDDTFCQRLITTYNLTEDPLRSRPGRIITAIYGLGIEDDHVSCDNCGYACKSENWMKTHISTSQPCNSYRRRYVQSFRSNADRMFFGVNLPRTSDATKDPLDPVTFLKAKFAPVPFNQVPIKSPAACNTSQFLNLEHWHKHLEGRSPAEVHGTVREREPNLRNEVRQVVERYAENAIKKLEKLDHEAKGAIGDYHG
jgi:hypothetical protein